jgi:hypothetical protein
MKSPCLRSVSPFWALTLAAIILLISPLKSMAAPDPHLPPIDLRLTLALGISDSTPTRSYYRSCAKKAEPLQKSNFSLDPCFALNFVRDEARPFFNLSQISLNPSVKSLSQNEERSVIQTWGQVVYFGEVHVDEQSKDFVKDLLPLLQQEGYDTLALEMFEAKDQKVLDDYRDNAATAEQVKAVLKAVWRYDSEPYMRMIESAHKLGFRFLALDERLPGHQDFIPDLVRRDAFMAEQIFRQLGKQPSSKVVAYTGGLHAACRLAEDGSMPTQVEILNKKGITANCFALRAKKKSGLYSGAAQFLGLSGNLFLPLQRSEAYLDGQFILE